LQQDILDTLEAWQPNLNAEGETNLEALLSESFFWTLSYQFTGRASCWAACTGFI